MNEPRKYAHDTQVEVETSRTKIRKLLRRWGCDGMVWGEDDRVGAAVLKFRWQWEEIDYVCRFVLKLPPDEALMSEWERSRPDWSDAYKLTKERMPQRREQRWRALHRVLLLTLTAKFNAIDAGLLTPPEVFLPNMLTLDGRTVAELMIPQLRELPVSGDAQRLLGMADER